MTILEKPAAKEQRSQSYRKKRRFAQADIEAPTLKTIVLLPATADDLGNQLHSRDRGLAMALSFARFPTADYPDDSTITVQALFNGSPVGNILTEKTPLKDEFFNQTLTIPAGHTNTAGEHKVQIRVKYRLNEDDSLVLAVRVDNTPPVLSAEVIVPEAIKSGGITAEFFDGSNFVPLSLASTYTGAKIGDTIKYFIKEAGQPTASATLIDTIVRTTLTVPLSTEKLTKALVGIEEGKVDVYAVATDRKGNVSQTSPLLVLDVSLFPAPRSEAATVDLHDDDGVLLFEDLRAPTATVLSYLNFKTDDKWRLSVDGQTPVQELNLSSGSYTHSFTYKYLHNGVNDEREADFRWQIRRGDKLYPTVAHSKKLTIDPRTPGEQPDPDNPGLPGTPDSRLGLITVQGVDKSRYNYLIAADAKAGAKAFVKIHKDHKAGEQVHLVFHGVEIEEAEGGVFTVTDSHDDDTVMWFDIPSDYIKGGGNNKQIRVEYFLSHDLNATVIRSNVQYVEAYINPASMPQADFAITGDAGDGPELYCGSLKHNGDLGTMAVEATFAGGSQFANSIVKFHVQGFANTQDPTGKNVPGLIIHDALDTVEITLDASGSAKSAFFTYHVFEKIKNGWCEITTATKQDGYATPSEPRLFRVGMERPGGAFCNIP
ncbi:hypothetical protein [Pseudomonas sp. O230]|uniref:hypothetical protein n=1 Tax=Pseudomonas sp. O230 TaxID=3159450 RepID=UPI00387AB8A5